MSSSGPIRLFFALYAAIVIMLLLLAWLYSGGLSTLTHAQSEEEPTGKLVVVPSSLTVGETAEVVAFDVEPQSWK